MLDLFGGQVCGIDALCGENRLYSSVDVMYVCMGLCADNILVGNDCEIVYLNLSMVV